MNDIEGQVITILADLAVMDASQVHPDMRLDQLGLDSLGLVESIFAIEETFDVSVPFNANATGNGQFDLSSVGSVISAVKTLVAARA